MKWNEYQFSPIYKTRERAMDSLEESFNDGEVDSTQNPRVDIVRNGLGKMQGYAIILTDRGL